MARHPSQLAEGDSSDEILDSLNFLWNCRWPCSSVFLQALMVQIMRFVVYLWSNLTPKVWSVINIFFAEAFLAVTCPEMKFLTQVIVVILEGVRGVDWFPVSLDSISMSRGKNYFYKSCQQYTDLNKVLSHPISHINLGATIEAVAFDFDCTSYFW